MCAAAHYAPHSSNPDQDQFLFRYRIHIVNEGDRPAQLVSRHWIIRDAEGNRQDVKGPGVVGETPRIVPGESFEYWSQCPLTTHWGTMEGAYRFQYDDGEVFDVEIGRFFLVPSVTAIPEPKP